MDERITAAVTAATEIADNARKVELADMEKVHTDALKSAEAIHKKELEDKQAGMFEHAVLLEKTRQMLGLSEEEFKKMKASKTPDEILTLVTSLDIKKEADVNASAKKDDKEGDTGIVIASVPQKQEEEPYLGAKIGNYAGSGKWE
jgi:tRNA G18 (ribose-2'-O)-methylase SpoU